MGEAKNVGINLDSKSIAILTKVDAIHRDSLINVGLALVEKTGYFKTLAGLNKTEDLDEVASLEVEDEEGDTSKPAKTSKATAKEEEKPKKPSTSWDSF